MVSENTAVTFNFSKTKFQNIYFLNQEKLKFLLSNVASCGCFKKKDWKFSSSFFSILILFFKYIEL